MFYVYNNKQFFVYLLADKLSKLISLEVNRTTGKISDTGRRLVYLNKFRALLTKMSRLVTT